MNPLGKIKYYLGNPHLKKVGISQQMTEDQVREFILCSQDPIYFIERYVKIITLDKGFINISLYPFQKQAITDINENRQVILKAGRQLGKTTMVVGYILWYILFNEDKFVAILANKAPTAREILSRIKIAYEALPLWLQQGVKTWNKGDIELENNCRVLASSTASSAIRGYSISCVTQETKVCIELNDNYYYTEISNLLNKSELAKVDLEKTMKYTVYQVTNKINGKIYVGFHKTTNPNDGYLGSGRLIKAAIEKYGVESFEKKILKIFDTKEEAEKYEATVVNKDFTLREDTYNISIGGNVRIMYGENNPFYGKTHDEETKKKMSELQSTRVHVGDVVEIEGIQYPNMQIARKSTGMTKQQIINSAGNPNKNVRFISEIKQKFAEEKFLGILESRKQQKIIAKKRFSGVAKTEEHKQKISAALRGKKRSEEHISKINKNPEKIAKTAAKHKGMKRSAEAKIKMSQAAKNRPAANKGLVYCYNPVTKEKTMCPLDQIPDGWVRGFLPK